MYVLKIDSIDILTILHYYPHPPILALFVILLCSPGAYLQGFTSVAPPEQACKCSAPSAFLSHVGAAEVRIQ